MSEVLSLLSGRHLLVTGTTGFLGKVWLAMMLEHTDIERFTVLVRGKKELSATKRFATIVETSPAFRPLREKLGAKFRSEIKRRVHVIDAKLVDPLCGLSQDAATTLMRDVDAVVHFAGLTDFEPDPHFAFAANIDGATHVADLAAMTKSKRYLHVSTCYVAGHNDGEVSEVIEHGVCPAGYSFDPKQELAELKDELRFCKSKQDRIDVANRRARKLGWPNIYTLTKGLSEHLLAERTDIVCATLRPAIVECARNYPFPGWNEGVNTSGPIVWLLSTSFQRFPAKKTNHFDVVPVDTVARATTLVLVDLLKDQSKEVYHCGSSHLNPFNFERSIELSCLGLRQSIDEHSSESERFVLRHLESSSFEGGENEVFGFRRLRSLAGATRRALRDVNVKKALPESAYKFVGESLEDEIRSFSMKCRTTDRKLGQVEDMLSAYRPFIYELDYVFRTDHLKQITEQLSEEDRAMFGFDIATLKWRPFWLKVQIPGLLKWSIPILRNEKVEEDQAMSGVWVSFEDATMSSSEDQPQSSAKRVSA